MNSISTVTYNALEQTLVSISHNWPFMAAGILIAAALKVFINTDKVAGFLVKWKGMGVLAATGAAVATPFCSCGTTAVVLGMMAGTMPLAPIIAFMIASPLSSPEGIVFSAGLFGWPFAIYYFAASILLGLAGGGIASILERKGLLAGQARFAPRPGYPAMDSGCCSHRISPEETGSLTFRNISGTTTLKPVRSVCACTSAGTAPRSKPRKPSRVLAFLKASLNVSRRLIPMFTGFAFIGYLVNGLIPSSLIPELFGSGHAYSVPLAATVGLPLYVSSEASLPLVRGLLDSGMSRGAIMAFLIAGSGTSIGAITGALTIARWKVVGLVTAVLWIGAIMAGYGFNILTAL